MAFLGCLSLFIPSPGGMGDSSSQFHLLSVATCGPSYFMGSRFHEGSRPSCVLPSRTPRSNPLCPCSGGTGKGQQFRRLSKRSEEETSASPSQPFSNPGGSSLGAWRESSFTGPGCPAGWPLLLPILLRRGEESLELRRNSISHPMLPGALVL